MIIQHRKIIPTREKAFPTPSKLSLPSSFSSPSSSPLPPLPAGIATMCQTKENDPPPLLLPRSGPDSSPPYCTGPENSAISTLRVVCKVVRYGAPLSLQLDGSNNGIALSLSGTPSPAPCFCI